MKKHCIQYFLTKTTRAVIAAAVTLLAATSAHASLPANTAGFHGGNWSSWVGLTTNVIQYPAGISNSTTPAQAIAVADAVANDYNGIGINFVRFPINPATISGNWAVTTNCINELLAQGLMVDICCWYIDDNATGYTGTGEIPNMTTWKTMWQKVDAVYGHNGNVYYEPINEPYGYPSESSLANVYTTFFGYGLAKPKDHMILDCGFDNIAPISSMASDSKLDGCFLSFHYYASANFSGNTTESGWITRLENEMGSQANANRTIMTEAGAVTVSGLNYDATSTDSNVCFVRGLATLASTTWPMGFCWFPTHQHLAANPSLSNPKRLFQDPGAGIINQSTVNQLQRGWNVQFAGVEDGAAAINSLNTPEIVGVDTSGNDVWHKWIQTSGSWGNWSSLGSPTGGAMQWGAIIAKNVDGRLEVFVTGANDGAVWHCYETASGWTSFSSLGGGGGNLSSPCVIADNDGRLNVFVVGSDNAIWWDKQTTPGNSTSWTGWNKISGTTAKSGEAPTAILNANAHGNGSMELIYNKQDNSGVCHVYQNTSGGSDWTWGGQHALGVGGGNLSGLTATRNADGRLDVSVVGSDDIVWHNWQTSAGGSWNGWYQFDTSKSPVSGQAPCIAVNQSGTLEMFINATDNGVYHIWQSSPGGGWNTWTSMGGGGHNLTRFWGITRPSGDLEVFVVGSDNAVWTDTQTSPGGNWSGWGSLGTPSGRTFASW